MRLFRFTDWLRPYKRETFTADFLAAVIVTVMLIPQSLAYAALAGVPAQAGLYASVLPLLAYALFGTSRVLAVGPVAVVSLMTAAAIAPHAAAGSAAYQEAALVLALLSGLMLWLMGALRLGFLANFLSHPVVSGFVTASALLIALSQAGVLLGIRAQGHSAWALLKSLLVQIGSAHLLTMGVGLTALGFLFWARKGAKPLLLRAGASPRVADLASKAAPALGVSLAAFLAASLDWAAQGLRVVGAVPSGLPPLTLPSWNPELWQALALPALLISVVGFVESVSVAQTLAAKRRQRIEPDAELVALGASNVSAALSGGFPVTGGFARSVVSFDAGAQTPAAGVLAAGGIVVAALFFTPALAHIPQAVLAATIIVAVLSLADFSVLTRTWRYAKSDFLAVLMTLLATLGLGVESGLVAGVAVSLVLYLYRTSKPHIAEVGLVPGTEHFRNVHRHQVLTDPRLLSLRVDESLYFANARALEDHVNASLAQHPGVEHLVLQCSAVNHIDASALESLEAIDQRLADAGVILHFSEIKGPVMDRLKQTDFLTHLRGQVFLSQFQAVQTLTPKLLQGQALESRPTQ